MNYVKKVWKNDFLVNVLLGIFIRGISFVVPYLLINPYLIRVLGEGQFGLISFSIAFVTLFFPFVEYGFLLTAPRDIALCQNDPPRIGKIVSNVVLVKTILLTASLAVALALILFEQRLAQEATLHIFSLLLIVGQAFMPSWLYQGLNRLAEFAIYTVLSNLFYLAYVYLCIRSNNDYLFVSLGQGLVWIFFYFTALLKIAYPFRKYFFFSLREAKKELGKSFFIFLTNFLHILFITSNIVILGFFVQGKELDNYSYAEKIYMVFRVAAGIIYQMVYPKVFLLKQQSEKIADRFLMKLFIGIFIVFGLASVVLFWQSDFIIQLFTGKNNTAAAELLCILSFSVLVYALSVPISQKILVFYSNKIFSVILFLVVVFNICLNFYSIPFYGAKGTAITLLLTEIFFLTLSAIYVFIAKNLTFK